MPTWMHVKSRTYSTVSEKLILMLEVDTVDWCKFSAAVYEISANWIFVLGTMGLRAGSTKEA